MNRVVRLFFAMLIAASSVAAHAAHYMKFEGVEGLAVSNDVIPNPADTYETIEINDWSWDIEYDHAIQDNFRIKFLNGQSPALTAAGWYVGGFFDIFYEVDLSIGGGPFIHNSGNGTAQVVGTAPAGPEPRLFQMEMLSLNISGVNGGITPFMIRESPTLASTGQTQIKNLGGGQFQIDSFFDVFTEISLDGGAIWRPSIPEPSTTLLAASATICVSLISRRRAVS